MVKINKTSRSPISKTSRASKSIATVPRVPKTKSSLKTVTLKNASPSKSIKTKSLHSILAAVKDPVYKSSKSEEKITTKRSKRSPTSSDSVNKSKLAFKIEKNKRIRKLQIVTILVNIILIIYSFQNLVAEIIVLLAKLLSQTMTRIILTFVYNMFIIVNCSTEIRYVRKQTIIMITSFYYIEMLISFLSLAALSFTIKSMLKIEDLESDNKSSNTTEVAIKADNTIDETLPTIDYSITDILIATIIIVMHLLIIWMVRAILNEHSDEKQTTIHKRKHHLKCKRPSSLCILSLSHEEVKEEKSKLKEKKESIRKTDETDNANKIYTRSLSTEL